jgi:hypothetical protein
MLTFTVVAPSTPVELTATFQGIRGDTPVPLAAPLLDVRALDWMMDEATCAGTFAGYITDWVESSAPAPSSPTHSRCPNITGSGKPPTGSPSLRASSTTKPTLGSGWTATSSGPDSHHPLAGHRRRYGLHQRRPLAIALGRRGSAS